MAAKVFPTTNDVGPSDGAGRVATEGNLSALFEAIGRPMGPSGDEYRNWVASGLELSVSTGYDFEMAAGAAFINGYLVVYDAAETISGAASKTYLVWLVLSRDGDGNVDGVSIYTRDVGSGDPAPTGQDHLYLGELKTDSGGSIYVNNNGKGRPFPLVGAYTGAGGTVTIDCGFTPSLVIVYGDGLVSFSELLPVTANTYGEDAYGASFAAQPGFYVVDGGADATPSADYTLRASKTHSAAFNITAGAVVSDTITVSGAAVGDPVIVESDDLAGGADLPKHARVTAANTVTYYTYNYTGSTVNLNGETFRVAVLKQQSGGISIPQKDLYYDGSGTGQKVPQIRDGGFAVNGSVTPSLNRSGVFYKFIAFP